MSMTRSSNSTSRVQGPLSTLRLPPPSPSNSSLMSSAQTSSTLSLLRSPQFPSSWPPDLLPELKSAQRQPREKTRVNVLTLLCKTLSPGYKKGKRICLISPALQMVQMCRSLQVTKAPPRGPNRGPEPENRGFTELELQGREGKPRAEKLRSDILDSGTPGGEGGEAGPTASRILNLRLQKEEIITTITIPTAATALPAR